MNYYNTTAARTLSAQTHTTVIHTQPNSLYNKSAARSRDNLSLNHTLNIHKTPLGNRESIGSVGRLVTDFSHPANHNNVFETLHNNNLSKEEKQERLLSLLRKSQSKQRHWSTGLCHCQESKKRHLFWQCLLGPIYQGCQAERMGEDFFTGCCMGSLLGIPLSCIPWFNSGAMVSLRTKIRERHNILGAIFEDWLIYLCCLGNCANSQLYRELDELGYPDSWLS